MFTLAWSERGDVDAAAIVALLGDPETPVETWESVDAPPRWVCRTSAAAEVPGNPDVVLARYEPIGSWGDDRRAAAPVANFVIRVVTPDARGDISTQLVEQANGGGGVLGRPGCVGLTLAAESGRPEAMLGISYWSSADDFAAYARWAQSAPWKDVITPVTVDVPLRLLARRAGV